MNNLRQAAQQTLEALKKCRDWPGAYDECSRALHALSAALAEPEQDWEAIAADQAMTIAMMQAGQEPVAWLLYKDGELYAIKFEKEDRGPRYRWEPLYTAPTPRKPLTDEELRECWDQVGNNETVWAMRVQFARAIERTHGIGEQT